MQSRHGVKTWLVVEDDQLAHANELFKDTDVQITTEGHRLLGAPIGTSRLCDTYT